MHVGFRWNRPTSQIVNEAIGGSRTQLFMANEAKRLMDPYVPALNLVLAQNVRTYVEDGHGVVHYLSPYARYQVRVSVRLAESLCTISPDTPWPRQSGRRQ